jgi:hypothetical protein
MFMAAWSSEDKIPQTSKTFRTIKRTFVQPGVSGKLSSRGTSLCASAWA